MTERFTVDTDKIALSSQCTVYKTEGFIAKTRKIVAIDAFLSRVAEGIIGANVFFDGCRAVSTDDGLYTLYLFRRGGLSQSDLVFYKFESAQKDEGGLDRRLKDYIGSRESISFVMQDTSDTAPQEDLQRLYLVSGSDGMINFPFLNDTQRKIVETEDSNMLVQGVAGSGKTNVCVEKIVYCACRNYRGGVLYTTFSRGLLSETRSRVELFLKNIRGFILAYESGNVVFLDSDHKKAVENKLGIMFSVDEDGEIISALRRIAAYLTEKVDYRLIEDIYAEQFESRPVAGESVFLNEYMSAPSRISGAIDKIKNISPEIIYKEIYGMIFGKYELDCPKEMMGKEEYIAARADSFTRRECETIYAVAENYAEFLEKQGYTDNNKMSRELINISSSPKYSLGVIDEVQDFTQVNLCLMKTLCRKLFCVGDALQMINPSYFGFAYLKRLMYGDVTGVSELKHNYRSTQKIERIAQKLGEMNTQRFGTHSFVLKGASVPSPLKSEAVFVKDKSFIYSLGDKRFENLTVVVGSQKKKEKLKKTLSKTEILTVAEAKGLERNTVVLVDVLSDNADKWRYLHEMSLNRKTADENSVFRYYFNLFYVGISRARQYLFVAESDYPKFFDSLFDECFQRRNKDNALSFLREIAGAIEIDDDEFAERIEKFCSLEQYENARFAADRLSSDELREKMLVYISVHERFLRYGKYRDAGVEYWRHGYDTEAREMFTRSGDEKLFPLMDACREGGSALDPEIVRFYTLVDDNDLAKSIILDTLNSDCKEISAAFKSANSIMKTKRRS
ncbi:MAG: UvrD-helicase domain-containing protein [Clostridiales bacterium]|nr:UvrD-helicase domain-containing protein [Clostridiales bacterium]